MEYRKGMWVTVGGQVGILNTIDPRNETGEVHFVDADGCTVDVMHVVPFGAIAQAAYLDIPDVRRPSEAIAREFGYL